MNAHNFQSRPLCEAAVRYVLIGSVALAIIAWISVEYFVRP
jgi:NADH:ubiquinone oxidoreductase subunit 2 (subunit N)